MEKRKEEAAEDLKCNCPALSRGLLTSLFHLQRSHGQADYMGSKGTAAPTQHFPGRNVKPRARRTESYRTLLSTNCSNKMCNPGCQILKLALVYKSCYHRPTSHSRVHIQTISPSRVPQQRMVNTGKQLKQYKHCVGHLAINS